MGSKAKRVKVKKVEIPSDIRQGDFLLLHNGSKVKFREWRGDVAVCYRSKDNYSMFKKSGCAWAATYEEESWVVAIQRAQRAKPKAAKITYTVYVGQVNQTFVTVKASSEEEARDRGAEMWRKHYACAHILRVESTPDSAAE